MPVFHNKERSGYEELLSYYPLFYKNILEMDVLLHICGRMIDDMADGMERVIDDNFIDRADEKTIEFLEGCFFLNKYAGSLEERRKILKSLFLGGGKINASKIKELIRIFTSSSVEIKLVGNYLKIMLSLLEGETISGDILLILDKKLPAHLAYIFIVIISLAVKQQIRYENSICFICTFYPRFNLEHLWLDGSWKLDGRYGLNGYKADQTLDFYPLYLEIGSGAMQDMEIVAVIVFTGNTAAHRIRASTGLVMLFEAEQSERVESVVESRSGAALALGTESHLTVEKDLWYLNGTVKLDGSRLLDAEIFEYKL